MYEPRSGPSRSPETTKNVAGTPRLSCTCAILTQAAAQAPGCSASYAGMNFVLYYRLITGNLKKVFADLEMRVYLGIFLVATLIIAVSLHGRQYDTFGFSLRYAGFQAASILTTTGYATADFAGWPNAAWAS